jgi:RNA polymerase sigma-70 factor, ECF subfamily
MSSNGPHDGDPLATKNAGYDLRLVPAVINGSIGALLYMDDMDGEIDHTLSMAIDGDKIAAIYLVRNPDKLRHVPVARQ